MTRRGAHVQSVRTVPSSASQRGVAASPASPLGAVVEADAESWLEDAPRARHPLVGTPRSEARSIPADLLQRGRAPNHAFESHATRSKSCVGGAAGAAGRRSSGGPPRRTPVPRFVSYFRSPAHRLALASGCQGLSRWCTWCTRTGSAEPRYCRLCTAPALARASSAALHWDRELARLRSGAWAPQLHCQKKRGSCLALRHPLPPPARMTRARLGEALGHAARTRARRTCGTPPHRAGATLTPPYSRRAQVLNVWSNLDNANEVRSSVSSGAVSAAH
jgi:hypothetical protein